MWRSCHTKMKQDWASNVSKIKVLKQKLHIVEHDHDQSSWLMSTTSFPKTLILMLSFFIGGVNGWYYFHIEKIVFSIIHSTHYK